MNKAQIKAELRRSACEDLWPLMDLHADAFLSARMSCIEHSHEYVVRLTDDDCRTFYLLVAEAL